MKILSKLIITLLLTGTLLAQWQQQNTPNNTDWYYGIEAVSQSVVYAVGERVLKTTNAGSNWTILSLPDFNPPLFDVHFYNENTGWLSGHSGKVFKTTNGGVNWTVTNAGVERLDCVFFINASTGFVCGYLGRLYKTTDGGDSWTPKNPGTSLTLKSLFFIDENTGWMGSGDNDSGIVKKTTNGGSTWFSIPINSPDEIETIQFLTSQLGFACSDYKIYKTTTGGSNWYEVNIPPVSGPFLTFEMANAIIGYAARGFHVLKTVDWGENWYEQYGVAGITNLDISFAPGSTSKGWMSGTDGAIISTTNSGGGFIGIQNISGEVPKEYNLSQNHPNPFNPATNINFSIPKAGYVNLVVYDITGKVVSTLVNEQLNAGTYKADFNASQLSSGLYFYRITAEGFNDVKKMMLVK